MLRPWPVPARGHFSQPADVFAVGVVPKSAPSLLRPAVSLPMTATCFALPPPARRKRLRQSQRQPLQSPLPQCPMLDFLDALAPGMVLLCGLIWTIIMVGICAIGIDSLIQ